MLENRIMRIRLFVPLVFSLLTASSSLHAQSPAACSLDNSCDAAQASVVAAQTGVADNQNTSDASGMDGQATQNPATENTDWSGIANSMQRPAQTASRNETGALRTPAQQQMLQPTVQQIRQQSEYPPAPPSEFQKFVAATTGQRLEIYGTDLFRKVPATFSPSNLTPARAEYILGPDDELRVRIWGAVNYTGNLRVDRSGNIYIPQVGSVHVDGLKFVELDHQLRAAIGRVYRNFDLTADLGRIRSIQVYITGQARRPGVYTVSALSTLVDALFASGGPAPSGSLRHIQLKRDGKVVTDFDLYALLLRGDKSKDLPLQPEDVLFIPPVGAQVAVTGSVRNAAIYELRDDETVADALEAAGRTSAMTANRKITLDRAEDNQRRAMDFALDAKGLAVALKDGDIVHVFSILPSYQKSVTLRGSVANPGHYGWHENMHLSDLLPDRESLLSRDYWWKRSHLGLSTPEYEALVAPVPDSLRNQLTTDIANTLRGDNTADSTDQEASKSGNFGTLASSSKSRVIANALNPGQGNNSVIGVNPEQIDWDYAVIERVDPVTLQSSLLPFDLGKLINGKDASQDLVLQPGDTVTIFSQSDIRVPDAQQTKYVTLEGEVVHAGTYSVNPGETLQDLVRRAGGLTSRAYLYGAEFDRASTRRLQQQRIDEYVRTMELETTRSSIAFANYAALSSQGGASAASGSVTQQFMEQLRNIRATGRVVLKIQPDSNSVEALPAIALENGDRLMIPVRPATVYVVGAVYDQNTVLYEKDGTVGGYLRQAGGVNRNADFNRAYLIHADGSVLNHNDVKSLIGNNFMHARLNPGDTLVVPDRNFRPNVSLKNVLEWTQMFSQLAMGAATIAILK
jgi:protein involved in polysaccharide export with SLBB domain